MKRVPVAIDQEIAWEERVRGLRVADVGVGLAMRSRDKPNQKRELC